LLGFTGEAVDALEMALGYAGSMKFMASLADKLGEDKFVSADGSKFNAQLTPAEAKAEYSRLTMDPQFSAALLDKQNAGHKAAVDKKAQLMTLIYGTT
jgi:hypothetical protein